jgi:hypothetical protein
VKTTENVKEGNENIREVMTLLWPPYPGNSVIRPVTLKSFPGQRFHTQL